MHFDQKRSVQLAILPEFSEQEKRVGLFTGSDAVQLRASPELDFFCRGLATFLGLPHFEVKCRRGNHQQCQTGTKHEDVGGMDSKGRAAGWLNDSRTQIPVRKIVFHPTE